MFKVKSRKEVKISQEHEGETFWVKVEPFGSMAMTAMYTEVRSRFTKEELEKLGGSEVAAEIDEEVFFNQTAKSITKWYGIADDSGKELALTSINKKAVLENIMEHYPDMYLKIMNVVTNVDVKKPKAGQSQS